MLEDKELMLDAVTHSGRPFKFPHLPDELHDKIVDGLDDRSLSFADAAKLCKEAGYPMHIETIRRYYRTLLSMRRKYSMSNAVQMALQRMEELSLEDAVRCFINLCLSIGMAGLIEGDIKIKDIDLGKILTSLPENIIQGIQALAKLQKAQPINVTPEASKAIREDVYGL